MSERDSQLQRDVDVDVDTELEIAARERGVDSGLGLDEGVSEYDAETHTARESTDDAGLIRGRVGSLLSTSGLVVAFVLSVLGIFVFGLIPLLPSIVTSLVGIFVAGFVYGTATDTRRYLECALGGALAGGGSVLLSYLFMALFGANATLLAIALVGGALAGTTGHYFGRDLRDGMTRDLGDTSGRRDPPDRGF